MASKDGTRKTNSIKVTNREVSKLAKQLPNKRVPKSLKTGPSLIMNELKKRTPKARVKKSGSGKK